MARQALMFEMSCPLPWDVSPLRRMIVGGVCWLNDILCLLLCYFLGGLVRDRPFAFLFMVGTFSCVHAKPGKFRVTAATIPSRFRVIHLNSY
jgi:hypothetical protein